MYDLLTRDVSSQINFVLSTDQREELVSSSSFPGSIPSLVMQQTDRFWGRRSRFSPTAWIRRCSCTHIHSTVKVAINLRGSSSHEQQEAAEAAVMCTATVALEAGLQVFVVGAALQLLMTQIPSIHPDPLTQRVKLSLLLSHRRIVKQQWLFTIDGPFSGKPSRNNFCQLTYYFKKGRRRFKDYTSLFLRSVTFFLPKCFPGPVQKLRGLSQFSSLYSYGQNKMMMMMDQC